MHFVAMLIVGLVVGVLAKLISAGSHSHSVVMTILLGLVGSFVAGTTGRAVGWYRTAEDAPGIIASTVGASGERANTRVRQSLMEPLRRGCSAARSHPR